ncbi:D-lactate dehydrogenase [Haemophilus influenzae HK1212]|uniref:D-lactate dehydrogenase n=1 Tax=Haemophilus influenzae HK1212 TaxID=456482 RepID=A0A7G2JWW9_HAEIF|nr:D-lactate dehydrogenase [Haemophilus influenzae HK1212]
MPTARHYEASGCAGKLAVFAVRLDTFPLEKETAVFYIGTNQTSVLSDIRRHMLVNFEVLPISGEYIHRDAFDIAAKYGKDTFWVIKKFGTHWLPKLFSLKSNVDRIGKKFHVHYIDEFLVLVLLVSQDILGGSVIKSHSIVLAIRAEANYVHAKLLLERLLLIVDFTTHESVLFLFLVKILRQAEFEKDAVVLCALHVSCAWLQ